MALRIKHRIDQGVMVLSAPLSLAALATRIVGTEEELVIINERTGSTLVRFTVPFGARPMEPTRARPMPSARHRTHGPTAALARPASPRVGTP